MLQKPERGRLKSGQVTVMKNTRPRGPYSSWFDLFASLASPPSVFPCFFNPLLTSGWLYQPTGAYIKERTYSDDQDTDPCFIYSWIVTLDKSHACSVSPEVK